MVDDELPQDGADPNDSANQEPAGGGDEDSKDDSEPGDDGHDGTGVVVPRHVQEMLRRAKESLRQPGLEKAIRAAQQPQVKAMIESVQARLDSVFESFRTTGVQDAIDAAFGRYQDQINELFRNVVPTIPHFSDLAEKVARAYRENLPPTWDPDNWHGVIDLMELTGWSLIHAPSAEVLAGLQGAATVDEAENRLLAREAAVLDDIDSVAGDVTAPHLLPYADGLRDAVSAARAGAHPAAQALAATLFTSAIHFDEPKLADARDKFEAADWMDGPMTMLRRYGVWLAAGRALSGFRPEKGDPVPTAFNRHATVHGYSPAQYRRPNALAGLLLVASYLRELQTDHDEAQDGTNGA